jgi:hypothetical protein
MTDKITIYRDDINLERAVDQLHRAAEDGTPREDVSAALWVWFKTAVNALAEDAAYYVDRIADTAYQPDEPERNSREIDRDRVRELEIRLHVHDVLYFEEGAERDQPTLDLIRRHSNVFALRPHFGRVHAVSLARPKPQDVGAGQS